MSATPLERYLAEQADLTPVERFSVVSSACAVPDTGTWQARIPLTAPAAGEQYAFDVDLDTCTGCKACVTACHNVNRLDEGESYRTVGLLTGGTPAQPFQQTVTTACHHCVDPACLNGCPTNAYEKDVFNGIVAHIEGRCLGCGYCTWTCPYEVPRFNSARGVVRKCDMCHDRLAVGEAPACVSACPNGAIRITVVDTAMVSVAVRGETLVPTAPPSDITLPTTTYRSDWGLPEGLRAAGATLGGHSQSHDPLVAMLVLTQAAAGALTVDLAVGHQRSTAAAALALVLAGLAVSVLHLGRPERAWRALAGFRHSWLSREIGVLGLFGGLALLAVATDSALLQAVAAATGMAGVACSAMLYVVTRRPSWRAFHTLPRFALGSAVGGAAVALAAGGGRSAAIVLAVALAAKLVWEAVTVWRLMPERPPERWLGPVPAHGLARFVLGVSAVFLALNSTGGPGAGLALVAVLAGELIERSRFFSAASWTGMPGPKR
ncbi:MAG: DmsC/YnfH family molybdoenzyme membrane anchor subunit [Acidimicrobiales bacterium]